MVIDIIIIQRLTLINKKNELHAQKKLKYQNSITCVQLLCMYLTMSEDTCYFSKHKL